MKGRFNKNIIKLMNEKKVSIEEVSKELKIPLYSLQKFLNEDYSGYSLTSIKDISRRLSEILEEKIYFIEDEEVQKERKKINKKLFAYLIVLWILIVFNIIFLVFLYKDVSIYSKIKNNKNFEIHIRNMGHSKVKMNNYLIAPDKEYLVNLGINDKIKIENNTGKIELKTPFDVYVIKLENFEVVLNGKVKKK